MFLPGLILSHALYYTSTSFLNYNLNSIEKMNSPGGVAEVLDLAGRLASLKSSFPHGFQI